MRKLMLAALISLVCGSAQAEVNLEKIFKGDFSETDKGQDKPRRKVFDSKGTGDCNPYKIGFIVLLKCDIDSRTERLASKDYGSYKGQMQGRLKDRVDLFEAVRDGALTERQAAREYRNLVSLEDAEDERDRKLTNDLIMMYLMSKGTSSSPSFSTDTTCRTEKSPFRGESTVKCSTW